MITRIGKLDDTIENRQKILEIVRNKENCYGINQYDYLTFVSFEIDFSGVEHQWWATVYMPTHKIRNCGINRSVSEYRYWHAYNGIINIQYNNIDEKNLKKLTMFQCFNAMRIYMTVYFEKTKDADIGLLLSDFMLSSDRSDWRENPRTWNPPAWNDWMDGVKKTLQDMKLIVPDPLWTTYNDQIAFLCMKNYLQLFYQVVAFEGVKNILKIITAVEIGSKTNKEWNYWLTCVQAAIDQEQDIIA